MARKVKKGSSQGKSKKKKKLIVPYIGVVSSIRITQDMRASFEAGLNGAAAVQYVANLKYKKRPLRQAIKTFNRDNDCILIVTIGGLVAWEAANGVLDQASDKKFVSMVGAVTDDESPRFYGGVSVQKPGSNEERIVSLMADKNFQRGEICLFYNPNSEQRNKELGEWKGANPVPGGINASGNNADDKYDRAFGKIPEAIKAVVVSADPYFQDTKDALIESANATTKYFCYPLQEYKNTGGTAQPLAGSARVHGPALTDAYAGMLTSAYKFLGQRAAAALAATGPLVPLIDMAASGAPTNL